jgi:hypothetical protein
MKGSEASWPVEFVSDKARNGPSIERCLYHSVAVGRILEPLTLRPRTFPGHTTIVVELPDYIVTTLNGDARMSSRGES